MRCNVFSSSWKSYHVLLLEDGIDAVDNLAISCGNPAAGCVYVTHSISVRNGAKEGSSEGGKRSQGERRYALRSAAVRRSFASYIFHPTIVLYCKP